MWRKYNDGYVTEVINTNEIFTQEQGDRPATPYFLVYIKEDAKETLVDSVCRDPLDPPQQEQDTTMVDYNEGIELPAIEANSYRQVSAPEDYELENPYQNLPYENDAAPWDDSYQKASATGW